MPPRFDDYIDDESAAHFEALKGLLDELGIAYVVNPRMVRGLDYYGRTVFEWITERLGAQGAVCAGGRYDGLVEIIGGKPTAAAGFALGLERVLLLRQAVQEADPEPPVHVYCCVLEPQWQGAVLATVQRLRDGLPGLRFRVHVGGGRLKSQLKRADQCGARWALLFGEDELRDNRMALKDLRSGAPQEALTAEAVIERLLGGTA